MLTFLNSSILLIYYISPKYNEFSLLTQGLKAEILGDVEISQLNDSALQ